MAEVTALIAQRNAGHIVARQVPKVRRVLEGLTSSYEMIVIDDASDPSSLRPLEALLEAEPGLRLLKFAPACGLSAALTAGLAAAEGTYVVTVPAGDDCTPELIESLLEELVRSDLVVGRPVRRGLAKVFHRIARIPRWLLLGLEVRDPECLVWAARREALVGLQLPCGMYRYLATLVAARGFRVGEITIPTTGRSVRLSDGVPNPGDLLAAWWFKRRWRQYERVVVAGAAGGGSRLRAAGLAVSVLPALPSDACGEVKRWSA
jgi:glycosyltransferase involved in cell wall biosynthesis